MFDYTRGSVSMLPNGEHKGEIIKTSPWNNPNGIDKLIVEILLDDGTIFSHFFTPGFPVFDDILTLAGADLTKASGQLDESKLMNKNVVFETQITKASNGNEYCNVETISEVKSDSKPAKVEESPKVDTPFD